MYWNSTDSLLISALFTININMRCIEIGLSPNRLHLPLRLTLTWDVLKSSRADSNYLWKRLTLTWDVLKYKGGVDYKVPIMININMRCIEMI